jgi:5,10-methylenetetrahydromethanopterin reductase
MKIGIGIGDVAGRGAPFDQLVAQAKRAEADGFASVWLAHIFGVDAMTAAAVCGRETTRIEIGTAVVPTYPRHPHAMAQQGMSVATAIGNRFALGIGLSHAPVIEGMFGLSYAKSYTHMKDYLAVLAPLVRDGKVHTTTGQFRVNATLTIGESRPCPILIAALAPKMLALAGAVADGTITWLTGPKTLATHTVPRIREAAAAAGRPSPRIVAGLPIAVTDNAQQARRTVSRLFQGYGSLPSYRAMLDREGAQGPADVAVVGDASAIREQLDALHASGVTDFLAFPFRVDSGDDSVERTKALLLEWSKANTSQT